MPDTQTPRRLGRSILAVFLGIAAVVLVTLATDQLLHVLKVFPPWRRPAPDGPLALATLYRTIYGIAGSYITARLAPYRPLYHAMIGGFIGLAVSILGAVLTWNKGPQFGPHWYPIVLCVLALPQSWLGGWLRERQLS